VPRVTICHRRKSIKKHKHAAARTPISEELDPIAPVAQVKPLHDLLGDIGVFFCKVSSTNTDKQSLSHHHVTKHSARSAPSSAPINKKSASTLQKIKLLGKQAADHTAQHSNSTQWYKLHSCKVGNTAQDPDNVSAAVPTWKVAQASPA
jgi:hypothetical protein